MKKIVATLTALWGTVSPALAQDMRTADGGGNYEIRNEACITPAAHQRIEQMLQANIEHLKATGKINATWGLSTAGSGTALKPTTGTFIWPLKQQPGFSYNSYYGISNYVDLNTLFPNQVLDYNCGARTYDQAQGYNHGGIDIFLWPFSQRMQEAGQVAVVAAADGVVIGREDGNFDKNCVMGGDQWNAVYIGNTDGTVCWYGHLKNGSLTTRQLGQTVTAGEYLGLVGSSGNSTGPHLHFETHNNIAQVIEPFAGPCNPGQASMWLNQKPYIDPTINAVMTHSSPPVFPDCPQLETINNTDAFVTGDPIYFAAYYHDQTATGTAGYKIYKPDNTVFDSWTASSNAPHYTASYWYWLKTVNATWPAGTWRFEVTYNGSTVIHNFTVNAGQTGMLSQQAAASGCSIYPNPNDGHFMIKVPESRAVTGIQLRDITGKLIATPPHNRTRDGYKIEEVLSAGLYWVNLAFEREAPLVMRFLVK